MPRLNFTLRTLLLLVAYIAAGCATLRYPNEWVAGAWLNATPCVLLVGTLGAAVYKAERRAFWLGFAIFGWGYWLLSDASFSEDMITDRLLRQFYFKVSLEGVDDRDPSLASRLKADDSRISNSSLDETRVQVIFALAQWVPPQGKEQAAAKKWEPSLSSYLAQGHCIVALLIAWLGGQLGKFMALSENSRKGSPPR